MREDNSVDHKTTLNAIKKILAQRNMALHEQQVSDIRRVLVELQRASFQRGYARGERTEREFPRT